jgi:7-cyano-7-deazaguanine synthase in queuosine biosynthesis
MKIVRDTEACRRFRAILAQRWQMVYAEGLIKIAHELDVPLEETWSYWADGVRQCGVCLGCLARKEGFRDPGIVDPTRYVDNSPYTGIPSR